ncbi:coil containing protein [Vibrio phage 1.186.O._10N.286.49.E3]|nr:coil containing protein [Vibrio phage 1.186.O._10N.286.49.E3]
MEYKILEGDIIEFGVDPSFDNDYENSYCASLRKEQLEFLLAKLNQEGEE